MGTISRVRSYIFRLRRRDDFSPHPTPFVFSDLRSFTEFRTGVENPKWRQQVADGQNATTNLTGQQIAWKGGSGFVRIDYNYDPVNGYNSKVHCISSAYGNIAAMAHPIPTIQTGWFSSAEDRAKARAYQAIRDLEVVVSGPTFLGEMRQTLRQLKSPLGALGRSAKDYIERVKRNRTKFPPGGPGLSEFSKTLSESWLEYSFGWVPLLADIAGIRDAYNSLVDKDRVVQFSVGAVSERLASDLFDDHAPWLSGGSKVWTTRRKRLIDTHSVRFKGAVVARAASTNKDRFARFGFTPSEFIPTLWELLPWSFLIDYVVNVDDLLTAGVTSTTGLSWCNKTVRRMALSRYVCTPNEATSKTHVAPQAFIGFSGRVSWSEYTVTQVVRSAGVELTPPSLYWELPSTERSPIKWLNTAALLNIARGVHPQQTSGRSYRI